MAEGDPPRAALLRLLDGFLVTQALHVAARLGVADALAGGPLGVEDLAARVGAQADRLGRVVALLVAEGVLVRGADGRLALGEAGAFLRSGVPGSLHAAAVLRGGLYAAAATALLDAVVEGATPYERVHGEPFFAHLARSPEREAAFATWMAGRSEAEAAAVVAALDLRGVRCVVDVGGGSGVLLRALLAAAPGARGVLVDRPEVVEAASAQLAGADVELAPGDFFAAVPAGGDLYVLSRVLHDWEDADAARVLRACRAAMAPGARLVVVDVVLPERPEEAPEAVRMDLHMLVLLGGRERTEAELRALLRECGFAVRSVALAPGHLGVLEAVAA